MGYVWQRGRLDFTLSVSSLIENFAAIASQYNENTFEWVFWEQHAHAASLKNAKGNSQQ